MTDYKMMFSQVVAEFSKVVADAPDYDTSVFDYEVQAHAAMGGLDAGGYEIGEDHGVESKGAEWIDGREIVFFGGWNETYGGHLVGVAKEFSKRTSPQEYSSDMYGGPVAAAVMMLDLESLARLSRHIPDLEYIVEQNPRIVSV